MIDNDFPHLIPIAKQFEQFDEVQLLGVLQRASIPSQFETIEWGYPGLYRFGEGTFPNFGLLLFKWEW